MITADHSNAVFVLVPGAWHPGWTWWPVARRLREAGAAVSVVELPGQRSGGDQAQGGLHIQCIVEALIDHLETYDLREVLLVGHSLGGYAINGALAEIAGRVRKVIYLNAHIPRPGVSMAAAFPERMAPLLVTSESTPDGSVPVPARDLLDAAFFPDTSPDMQELLADLLVPTPGAYFREALRDPTLPAQHGIDCAYVLSEHDVILPPPADQFPAMVGVSPTVAPGGHESLITHPGDVADILLALTR